MSKFPLSKFKNSIRSLISSYFYFVNKDKSDKSDRNHLVLFRNILISCKYSTKLEYKLLTNPDLYDLENFYVISHLVNDEDICFDIGANIGIYSLVLSDLVGLKGSIHSFEPVEHIRQKLLLNLTLNRAKNILVNDFALGDTSGEFPMFQVKDGEFRQGTSTLISNNNIEEMGESCFKKQQVIVKTVDEYVVEKDLTRLDFIKIDVEGFEKNVIQGGRNVIKKFKPNILFEHNIYRLEKLGISELEVSKILLDLGYFCFEVLIEKNQFLLVPYFFDGTIKGTNILALYMFK